MRILIDLEAVQSGGAGDRAGRLLLDLAEALARAASGTDQILVLLNDAWPETVLRLRADLDGLLPPGAVRVWSAGVPGGRGAPDGVAIRAAVIGAMDPALVIAGGADTGTVPEPDRLVARVDDAPPRLSLFAAGRGELLDVIDLPLSGTKEGGRQVLDRLRNHLDARVQGDALPQDRPRLAYVSPLMPQASGIATYARDLLPALARWYRIDVVADQAAVTDPWVLDHATILDPATFLQRAGDYARVLYHFGNSGLHPFMLPLLEQVPGVVMLHDFFLGQALAEAGQEPFRRALAESHGAFAALGAAPEHLEAAKATWPANLAVLQQATGVIVHSRTARRLAEAWYGPDVARSWAVIPHLRQAHRLDEATRQAARAELGLAPDALVICSFGLIGPSKLSHLVLEAFSRPPLADDPGAVLVFVGRNDTGRYGRDLLAAIAAAGLADRVRITGWADDALYEGYLRAADIAVQLRSLSRGETSGAVIDCMAHGLATVVNAHGTLADLDPETVVMLPDAVAAGPLAEAMAALAADPALRARIGAAALVLIERDHAPATCAERFARAIEGFHAADARGLGGALRRIAFPGLAPDSLTDIAGALAWNIPPAPRLRQLLVDVSAILQVDLRTGVQRVVRQILTEWLRAPPAGWAVLPVYGTGTVPGYRHARHWTDTFLNLPPHAPDGDAPVDAWPGDVFLGLDLNGTGPVANQALLDAWHRKGVDVRFVVYDLLPVRLPQHFPPAEPPHFERWLSTITRYGGAVCISRAVAADLADWMRRNVEPSALPFRIDSFRLGADIRGPTSTGGLPPGSRAALEAIAAQPSFLMVGTLEPRKGHAQTLAAFESLWTAGQTEARLVIVGKQGWQVEGLCDRLRRHPEAGRRLFWFDAASDALLERLYGTATCLLMPSEGEGFGLPLIEAAQVQMPILARDLPVFREVAGDHAAYFAGLAPEDLARAVRDWLVLWAEGRHPRSDGLAHPSWADSAAELLAVLAIDPRPAPMASPEGR